jgi:hypothetical protein
MDRQNASRRDFVTKGAYIVPAIVTLAVAPSYAKAGSGKPVTVPPVTVPPVTVPPVKVPPVKVPPVKVPPVKVPPARG